MSQMTVAIIIFIVSLALYLTNIFPMAITAILTTMAFFFAGCITQAEAFVGYSDGSALIMAGMFVVCAGFMRTQFMDHLSAKIAKLSGGSLKKAWAGLIVMGVLATNFISSPPAAFAFCVPFCLAICKEFKLSPAKLMFGLGVVVIGNAGALPFATNIYIATRNVGYFEAYNLAQYALDPIDYTLGRFPVMLMTMVWAYFYTLKFGPDEPDVPPQDITGAAEKAARAPLTPFQEKAAIVIFFVVAFFQAFANQLGVSAWQSAVVGGLLMVLCGVLNEKDAIKALPLSMIAIYAGGLATGTALYSTGAADVIGNWLAALVGHTTNNMVLGTLFFVVPFVLTQFMSNAGVTALFIPLAMLTCNSMGADPRGIVILVGSAAMTAFLTPMATVTVPMVMGAGGYKINSLFKHGWLISILMAIAYVPWVMWIFPAF